MDINLDKCKLKRQRNPTRVFRLWKVEVLFGKGLKMLVLAICVVFVKDNYDTIMVMLLVSGKESNLM